MVSSHWFRSPAKTAVGLKAIVVLSIAAVGVTVLGGCSSEAPIVTYQIPTTVPAALTTEDTRMVAAILPQETQAWFFKVMGRQSAVDSVADEFREFVQTVEFADGVPILDELPEGWRRGGEKAMRFASIDIDTPTQQLDISISQLTRMEDWDEMIAMNVNRWRGQVGLKDTDEKWAGAAVLDSKLNTDAAPAVWIDVTGRPDNSSAPMGGMMGGASPPFANMASSGGERGEMSDPHAGLPREAREAIASGKLKAPGKAIKSDSSSPTMADSGGADEAPNESKLKFDRPEGWRDGRMSMMRLAAFDVGPEDAPAEITVITAGGDLRGNVARWMGQISESAVPDEEVDAALENAEKLKVDGRDSQRFVLLPKDPKSKEESDSPASAIDATIVPMQDGFSMFVKMTGPADLIKEQDEQMRAFLKSLRF